MHNVACITMAVLMVATKRIAEKLGELTDRGDGRKDAKTSYGIVCLLILIII